MSIWLTDVAEELDGRLYPPIVVIIRQQGVSEEVLIGSALRLGTATWGATYARVESTHVSIWHRMPIDDLLLDHLFPVVLCFLLIDPAASAQCHE
jgi:hypothetical protein